MNNHNGAKKSYGVLAQSIVLQFYCLTLILCIIVWNSTELIYDDRTGIKCQDENGSRRGPKLSGVASWGERQNALKVVYFSYRTTASIARVFIKPMASFRNGRNLILLRLNDGEQMTLNLFFFIYMNSSLICQYLINKESRISVRRNFANDLIDLG